MRFRVELFLNDIQIDIFQPTALSQLKYAELTELYLRDGEVVIHRRPGRPSPNLKASCNRALQNVGLPDKFSDRP